MPIIIYMQSLYIHEKNFKQILTLIDIMLYNIYINIKYKSRGTIIQTIGTGVYNKWGNESLILLE